MEIEGEKRKLKKNLKNVQHLISQDKPWDDGGWRSSTQRSPVVKAERARAICPGLSSVML